MLIYNSPFSCPNAVICNGILFSPMGGVVGEGVARDGDDLFYLSIYIAIYFYASVLNF